MAPNRAARFALGPSVLICPDADGYLLYEVDAARLHHLNPIASLIVELCDGSRDLDAIRQSLLPLVGEAGWIGVRGWIDGAVASGLIDSGSTPATPRPPLTANALTKLARELRDRDEVLPAFICQQHAAELAPDTPRMWYLLGELAHIVGRRDEARAAYERYFERCPDDAEIEHILRALRDEAPPARVPDRYIKTLYTRFAPFYDRSMSADLEYRAPTLLQEAVEAAIGDRRQLDIADLGCGSGLSGLALRPLARRLIGVDLSKPMINRARARRVYDVLRLVEITAFLASSDAGPFDLIASCDAFIYFGDLRQLVPPASRRLAPNGIMAFTLERGDAYPFKLTDSGRFAHHRNHVAEVAGEAGLSVLELRDAVLRYEYGHPVTGLVAVLGSRSSS